MVTDALYFLNFSFLQGPAPPEPFPSCGMGSTSDLTLGYEAASVGC